MKISFMATKLETNNPDKFHKLSIKIKVFLSSYSLVIFSSFRVLSNPQSINCILSLKTILLLWKHKKLVI